MPRKTMRTGNGTDLDKKASMRPRPDAAENGVRPRSSVSGSEASMRPRPDAAENGQHGRGSRGGRRASMRPRPDAAENKGALMDDKHLPGGFNEAAARCRGKPTRSISRVSFSRASLQ